MVKCRVVYAKSAVLLLPINKVLDLRKCVDCLWNYTRMYGCYLTQCLVGYSPPYIYYVLLHIRSCHHRLSLLHSFSTYYTIRMYNST